LVHLEEEIKKYQRTVRQVWGVNDICAIKEIKRLPAKHHFLLTPNL
jgi:hypothetical protein